MAKKSTIEGVKDENKKELEQQDLYFKMTEDYWIDFEAMEQTFLRFEDYESILLGQPKDKMSARSRSKITDSLLTTLAIEGTARTIATLPTGATKAATMKDKGQALVLDIARQRYVLPNANTQHPQLTKVRMWDFYKRVYGYSFMQYGWVVKPDYIGPDDWMVHPRNVIFQRGKISVADSDYIYVDTWNTIPTLQGWLEEEGWDKENVQAVIDYLEGSKSFAVKDERQKSFIEKDRNTDGRLSKGSIKLTTKYEAGKDGHWITICPALGLVLRDIPNPHNDSRIPLVQNITYPLLDSMQALGDFERGKSLQFARDGITNSFALGFNMSILPPAIINPNGVIPSTIKYLPNQIWQEIIPNSVRRFEVNPNSINTYQAAYNILTGMQYNQVGATDTRLSQESTADPGFGRTPAAIERQTSRENARDNWNRSLTENALETLYDNMMQLFSTMQKTEIIIDLFDTEVGLIKEMGYDSFDSMLQVNDKGTYAKLTIPKDFFKNSSYRFYIDADSTQKEDVEAQRESINELIALFNKVPQLKEYLDEGGYVFDFGKAIYRYILSIGIDGADQIIRPMTEKERNDLEAKKEKERQDMAKQAQIQNDAARASAMTNAGIIQPGQAPPTMNTPIAAQAMDAVLSRFNDGGTIAPTITPNMLPPQQ